MTKYNFHCLRDNESASSSKTAENDVPQKCCRRSVIAQTTLGDHVCLFCAGKDLPTNLCAAGTWHAKITQVYRQHVDKISEQLRSVAMFLNGLSVLSKLF